MSSNPRAMSSSSSAFSSKSKKSRSSSIRSAPSRSCKWSFSNRLVEEWKALAKRAAVGLRSAAVRRGRRRIPRRLPWGRLAMRRRRVGAAPPAGRRCKRPDRCADNDCTRLLLPRRQKYLGQMDELGELRRPRDLVAPLVAQKGLQRVEKRRGLAALVPVHLAQHRQEPR